VTNIFESIKRIVTLELKNVSNGSGDIHHRDIGLTKNRPIWRKGSTNMDSIKMVKNEASILRKKVINQMTLILYGFMLFAPILIWYLLNNAIKTNSHANMWTAILTTLLANGLVGMINTFVLSKEKDKVLDESIERVKAAFLDEQFVVEKIDVSLNRVSNIVIIKSKHLGFTLFLQLKLFLL
jgi:hypothetical protein